MVTTICYRTQLDLRPIPPQWLPLFLIPTMIWRILWSIWKKIKIKIHMRGIVVYWCAAIFIDVDQLIVLETLILRTSYTSLTSLGILIILDSVSGRFRITRQLQSLQIISFCVMRILFTLRSSLYINTLFKRLHTNTTTCWLKALGTR